MNELLGIWTLLERLRRPRLKMDQGRTRKLKKLMGPIKRSKRGR